MSWRVQRLLAQLYALCPPRTRGCWWAYFDCCNKAELSPVELKTTVSQATRPAGKATNLVKVSSLELTITPSLLITPRP
jgi:hypothetical protein